MNILIIMTKLETQLKIKIKAFIKFNNSNKIFRFNIFYLNYHNYTI